MLQLLPIAQFHVSEHKMMGEHHTLTQVQVSAFGSKNSLPYFNSSVFVRSIDCSGSGVKTKTR